MLSKAFSKVLEKSKKKVLLAIIRKLFIFLCYKNCTELFYPILSGIKISKNKTK